MKRALIAMAVLLLFAQSALPQDEGREYTLEEVLRAALGPNEQIGQVEQEVAKSRLLRKQAWLAVVPTASLTGNFTRNDTEQKIEFDIPGFMLDEIIEGPLFNPESPAVVAGEDFRFPVGYRSDCSFT